MSRRSPAMSRLDVKLGRSVAVVGGAVAAHYEVRIAAPVAEAAWLALQDLGVSVVSVGRSVVVRGEMDQPMLHGLLERVRALGLQLEGVRRFAPAAFSHRLTTRAVPWTAHRRRRERGRMPKTTYEIRVAGVIGPAVREAFRHLAVEVDPATTVLTAELEPAELHAVLDTVRDLGLELVEVHHHGGPAAARGLGRPGHGAAAGATQVTAMLPAATTAE
jgi:hypothetical protein